MPWRSWTLAQMHLGRVEVHSRCGRCGVRLQVNVAALIRAIGPDATLWNRDAPCRVVGCDGRVSFWGRERRGASFTRLKGSPPREPEPRPEKPRWAGGDPP